MFDVIFNALKKEDSISHLGEILGTLARLVDLVGEDYLKDPNLRNNVLDAIMQILAEHKK